MNINKLTSLEILNKKHHKTRFISDLKDMIYKSSEIFPKRVAFKLKNKNGNIYKVTYAQLIKDIESLGTHFINMGLKDSAIAIVGKNSYYWAISYIAASCVGLVVPIDKELHDDEIINFINAADCKAIVGDEKYIELVKENTSKIQNKALIYINMDMTHSNKDVFSLENLVLEGEASVKRGNNTFKDLIINPDDTHILIFTSGTTGKAKGVCLSHKNICSNIISTAKMVKVKSSDQVLSILPLHHTYECTLGFLLILYRGGCISYCEGLKYINKNISEFKPSLIVCVPLLLENIYKKLSKSVISSLPKKYKAKLNLEEESTNLLAGLPFYVKSVVTRKIKNSLGGRLRLFITGAANISPDIVEAFYNLNFKVYQGYGLTECAPLLVGNNDFFVKYDSTGLAIPDVEVKISNPDDEGIGEIIAKGPNIMKGYYNDEEETNKVFKDGWFYTGDLGKIDKNGFVYITGRIKNVIVTKNGKNIYPEEIEYYLNKNPLISEALIIGQNFDDNDETYVNAHVFPDTGAIKEYLQNAIPTKEEIYATIKDIIAGVNNKLPNYKHIKKFIIRDEEFEKTTTKKIKRFRSDVNDDDLTL